MLRVMLRQPTGRGFQNAGEASINHCQNSPPNFFAAVTLIARLAHRTLSTRQKLLLEFIPNFHYATNFFFNSTAIVYFFNENPFSNLHPYFIICTNFFRSQKITWFIRQNVHFQTQLNASKTANFNDFW
jgi:hypothetical protein